MMAILSRGIRNHNPGNLRHGEKWQGLRQHQTDSDFCQFVAPIWGIRALFKVLLTYQKHYQAKTVRQIVSRFAPPHENDTERYVNFVSRQLGGEADDIVNLHDKTTLYILTKAIILMENGRQHPYCLEQYDMAFQLL